jgi:hypothetical protein
MLRLLTLPVFLQIDIIVNYNRSGRWLRWGENVVRVTSCIAESLIRGRGMGVVLTLIFVLLARIDVGLYTLVDVSVGCVESSGVGSSVFISMIALTEMGCEDRRWMELAQDVLRTGGLWS